jgi:Cu/Ag efflux pump CusA
LTITSLSEIDDTLRQKSADQPADAITVRVFGEDDKILQEKAAEIAQRAKGIPGVEAVRTHPLLQAPAIEIETDLGRAEQHGIKPGDVRRATSTVLSWHPGGRPLPGPEDLRCGRVG